MARKISLFILPILLLFLTVLLTAYYSVPHTRPAWADEVEQTEIRAGLDSTNPQSAADLKKLYAETTSVTDKLQLVSEAGNMARWQLSGTLRNEVINWLEDLSRQSDNNAVKQSVLYQLYHNQSPDALPRLVREIDEHGIAWIEGAIGWPRMDWQFLKELYEKYPGSYLARGISAYEKVRGESYFAIERRKLIPEDQWHMDYTHGDQQYDPDSEIPGWESFLKEYSSHPAADDAAYRLARCYEIKERWRDALRTLLGAMSLPDGDIRYHAAGRLIYILDVQMSVSQLEKLIDENPELPIQQMAEYSLAVKNLRSGNYREAVTRLEEFLVDLHSGAVPANLSPFMSADVFWGVEYDFTGGIEKQLEQAKKLADLAEVRVNSKDPADTYKLAAVIFHDQTLYYNHLWAGYRQFFNWQGYILSYYDDDGPLEMAKFAQGMINYCHSGELFNEIYQNPGSSPELKSKALFSLGLSQLGIYNWGQDAFVAFDRDELKSEIINTFEKFVTEYPRSTMADEALLALSDISRQRIYLDKIFEKYPESDSVSKAKALLEEMNPRW